MRDWNRKPNSIVPNQTGLAPLAEPATGLFKSAMAAPPSRKQREIADLAFEFWLARGFHGGSPEEDLLRAEREMKARTQRIRKTTARLFLVPRPGS